MTKDIRITFRDTPEDYERIRSKTLRKEREKKIALGHKADDHEDEQNWQQTM